MITISRADEFIVEAELIQKGLQAGIVVGAKAVMGAEGIRHLGQGHFQIPRQHLLVGDVVGNLAQAVHIIGKGHQSGRNIAEFVKRPAHHGGSRHLAKGADVRQAGGAVACFKQHMALLGCLPVDPFQQSTGLLKRPGFVVGSDFRMFCHDALSLRGWDIREYFGHVNRW